MPPDRRCTWRLSESVSSTERAALLEILRPMVDRNRILHRLLLSHPVELRLHSAALEPPAEEAHPLALRLLLLILDGLLRLALPRNPKEDLLHARLTERPLDDTSALRPA